MLELTIKRAIGACGLLLAASLQTASGALVVDRGLPTANLNNAAGSDRSNVAWDFNPAESYVSGDDFALPYEGNWQIDTVRVWAIDSAGPLGDNFDTISLFMGDASGSSISRVSTAGILSGTSDSDNVDVVITPVTYTDGSDYQGSSGGSIQIWQIDFNNLGMFTGEELMFGADATGDSDLNWFNHASNAALSGSAQDGSDDMMRWFSGSAESASLTLGGMWDSNGNGWDKSSDHNIQVFATNVPEPGSLALLGMGLVGFLVSRKKLKA